MALDPQANPAVFWTWFISLAGLSILMVLAMVPFSVALLYPPRRARARPQGLDEVREALLALNRPERPFRLTPLSERELRLDWDVVDASWYELFASVKLTAVYRARVGLAEAEREVRYHESLRSASFFLGFEGLKPRFNWSFYFRSGVLDVMWSGLAYGIKKGFPPRIGEVYRFSLNTVRAKQEIEDAARKVGWTFRPVLWGFETTDAGADWVKRLTPPFMRGWSRRRFWGVLYVGSWIAILAVVLAVIPLTPSNVLAMLLVVGGFWAIQGLILGVGFGIQWLNKRRRPGQQRRAAGQP